MADRGQVAILAACAAIATILATAPATATQGTTLDVRDEFNDVSFSGSDGPDEWVGPWTEKGEKNGAAAGAVRVTAATPCWNAYCLRVGGDDVRFAGRGVERAVDLTDAATATLSFTYLRTLLDDDGGDKGNSSMKVKVVTPDGVSKLAVYPLDGEDAAPVAERLDLTPYVGAVVTITIKGVGDASAYFSFDDVVVTAELSVPGSTTTTTTSPPATTTTTTTPPATTTTTTPPATTTTTTTQPPPTGTTPPPTTTLPGSTTTTVPPAPPAEPPPSEPPPPPADVREIPSYSEKDDLAATSVGPDVVMIEEAPTVPQLDPATRLGVVATTTVATLGVNLIPALALGLLVAWLALRGLGSRTEDPRRH